MQNLFTCKTKKNKPYLYNLKEWIRVYEYICKIIQMVGHSEKSRLSYEWLYLLKLNVQKARGDMVVEFDGFINRKIN